MFWKYLFSGLFVQKSMLPLQNQDFVPETVDSWSLCFTRHCTNTTGIASVSTCTWTCSLFQFVWDLVETCTKYDTGLGGLDHPANVLWFLEYTEQIWDPSSQNRNWFFRWSFSIFSFFFAIEKSTGSNSSAELSPALKVFRTAMEEVIFRLKKLRFFLPEN